MSKQYLLLWFVCLLNPIALPTASDVSPTHYLDNIENRHLIWSQQPADEWPLGYPIGNGRIGGMVMGDPLAERIGLNHDRLWRKYYTFKRYDIASVMPQFRRLCLEHQWDQAQELLLSKLPDGGNATDIFINPYIPAGDLGIYPAHENPNNIRNYRRQLNLNTGTVEVSYTINDITYRRESFVSWPAGVLVIRLTASQPGALNGEIALSRLLDPDCQMTGISQPGELMIKGELDEGVTFTCVARLSAENGSLHTKKKTYQPPAGQMPEKSVPNTFSLFLWGEPRSIEPAGVSNTYESADEVVILLAIATDDETATDQEEWCRKQLSSVTSDFTQLREEHIKDHQQYYQRVDLNLSQNQRSTPTNQRVQQACQTGRATPELIELMFHMGRYLAIASGRPQPPDQPAKSPINLQGIWNQDRRPGWDSDIHLDLNVQMCYWPLNMVNLPEWIDPLADWMLSMVPKARVAARDRFTCRGVFFNMVCGLRQIGNLDRNCISWTGGAAWLAQLLWQNWEYTQDKIFLREKLYPLLKEIALFYQDNMIANEKGELLPCPSCSPEMPIKGRKEYNVLAPASTMDLELVREVFTHVIAASEILEADANQRPVWKAILQKVPMPVLSGDGRLQEWTIDYEDGDPGHRHRSHLIGLVPGDRITFEKTPDYFDGVRKALTRRHKAGRNSGMSFSTVWDAQLHARLYEGEEAMRQLNYTVTSHVMDNLLMSLGDWRDRGQSLRVFGDKKFFQVEAGIAVVASIAELFFQDRGGLLRLLPALPQDLPNGHIKGLQSRSGFEVDIQWENHQLVEANIKSLRGEPCCLKIFTNPGNIQIYQDNEPVKYQFVDNIYEFDTQKGIIYTVRPENN